MSVSIRYLYSHTTTTGYTYLYDQLNRLLNTRQHTFGAASGSFMGNWTQSNTNSTDNYAETFRYDANGNILQLNRNGNSQHPGGLAMDRLNYTYRDGTNQLWSVQDGIAAGAYAGDIDNQGGSNYSYDRIGNLIGDVSENISQVNWTVYGKIGNIQKKQAFLGYVYNAGGERVVKQYLPYATNQCLGCDENTGLEDLEVYERNSNTPSVYKASKTITFLSEYTDVRYTEYTAIIEAGLALCTPQCNVQPPLNTSDADIYIRDATGNVLAVYHYDRKTAQLRWSEQHLYGSARLGMYQPEKIVTSVSTDSKQREVGYLGKQIFELSNHLGNILATITDKKLQVSTNTTSTDYFEADVQTVQDYYAFGMQMPGRKLSGGYRYGFNGKENDNEVKGEGNIIDFGERIYESRLGRWLAVDMAAKSSPGETPYRFGHNNPVRFLDPNGQWEEDGHFWTVYAMGVAKGLSKARAYEIAKKAEYFDHFVHKDANGNINMRIHPSSTGLAWGKDGGLGTWADGSKQGDWHALTGGLQAHANNRAKHNILIEGDLNYLHTLGDSWAHSYVDDDGTRKMWGKNLLGFVDYTIEHGFGGGHGSENADEISKRPQEYGAWVNDLNNVMNNDLFAFKSEIKNLNPDKSIFRYVQQNGGSKEANIYLLKNYIDLQNGTKSFSTANENFSKKFEGYLKSMGIKYTSSTTITETSRMSISASGNVPISSSTKTTSYNIKINQ